MNITLLSGDGVGPEIISHVVRIMDSLSLNIKWDSFEVGLSSFEKCGTFLPQHVLDSIRENKVALKGPLSTPIGDGFRSVNVDLRRKLDLFACVRPSISYEGIDCHEDIDLVIVRENTEDLYVGVEWSAGSDEAEKIIEMSDGKIKSNSAISIKPISRFASERIIRFAFDYAVKNNRKKVTVVTKANILKCTDGLFLSTGKYVAKDYPQIEHQEILIDNMCMQLVKKPQLYDVLVLPNLYGDIVSDLASGLVGGLGVAPGVNVNNDISVFESVHGAAPKYVGQNKINPLACLLSSVLMLKHVGYDEASHRLITAIKNVLREGRCLTYDLAKNADSVASTSQFCDAVIDALNRI